MYVIVMSRYSVISGLVLMSSHFWPLVISWPLTSLLLHLVKSLIKRLSSQSHVKSSPSKTIVQSSFWFLSGCSLTPCPVQKNHPNLSCSFVFCPVPLFPFLSRPSLLSHPVSHLSSRSSQSPRNSEDHVALGDSWRLHSRMNVCIHSHKFPAS